MANICNTTYEIFGTKEELNKLKSVLNKAIEICKARNLKEIDDFFNREKELCKNDEQLTDLVKRVNRKKEHVDTDPWVSDFYEALTSKTDYYDFAEGDGNMFFISCEDDRVIIDIDSKWVKVEEFEDMLNNYFEDLSVFYLTEEFGCGIWETNDTKGDIFSDKYYVELDGDGDYFETDEKLLEYVNEYFEEYAEGEHNFQDVKSFKEYLDNLDPESEEYYVLMEVERI